MRLSFGELEGFLALLHEVAPEKHGALKARMKHLQRLGWPVGANRGRGAKEGYGVDQSLSLAMAFEMLRLGMTPERVLAQLTIERGYMVHGFLDALAQPSVDPDPVFYVFSPNALQSLRPSTAAEPGGSSMMISRSEIPSLLLSAPVFQTPRFAVIDMHALLMAFIAFARDTRGINGTSEIKKALEDWELDRAKAVQKASPNPPSNS